MKEKIQLEHPQGKKPIRMSKEKYDLLKPVVVRFLRTKGEATLTEIKSAIEEEFKAKGHKFDGSLQWHLEWVKLDLEARRVIRRVAKTSPQKYMVVRAVKNML